jgi:hypothetical protein
LRRLLLRLLGVKLLLFSSTMNSTTT